MRRRPAAALLALACAAAAPGPAPALARTSPARHADRARLVHAGVPAVPGERRFQAAVLESGVAICGGVILDPWRVATAAHCVFGSDQDYLLAQPPSALRVFTGSVRLSAGGRRAEVAQVSFDPRFDARSFDFDVAVLRLDRPLAFDETTAPIVPAAASPPDGTPALVSGWGEVRDHDPYQPDGSRYPDTLRIGELRTVPDAACAAAYPELPPAPQAALCTTSADPGAGTDACQGDSGGPLTSGGLLVGLVSSGTDCGNPSYPGVQTEVAEPGVHRFLTRSGLPPAPRPTGPLAVSGTAEAGAAMRCETGGWTGAPLLRFQWLRDGGRLADTPVSAPSEDPGYVPSEADVGHGLRCVVRATGEGGYGVQASPPSAVVARGARPAPPPPPPAPVEDLRPAPRIPAAADGARPVVRVPRASCSRRARRCTLTATVADRRPSAGIARLEVRLTSTSRTTCPRRTRGRARRVPCTRTTARPVRPKALGNLTYRVQSPRLRHGRHRFRLVAVDRAGHRSLPVGRTLSLPRSTGARP